MSDAATVPGKLLRAPDGGAQHRVVVECCGGCGYPHVHHVAVGADLSALERSPRGDRGRVYRIAIAETLPAAVVA
jgi:hypothetical protein